MCGLVGGAGDLTGGNGRMVKTMLELDIIRGEDSTGVMLNLEKDGPTIFKELSVPWYGLYQNKEFIEAVDKKFNVFLGHNRAATFGEVVKENAHPFQQEHIFGAHNGTLTSTINLENNKLFEVDSENIFHHMSIHGVSETVDKLRGAFALTWYNQEDNTINFVRNSQRPLWFAFTKDKRTLFWASEYWMLDRAAIKAKVNLEKIYSVEELTHYSIVVPEMKLLWQEKSFGRIRVKKLLPHRFPTTTTHTNTRTTPVNLTSTKPGGNYPFRVVSEVTKPPKKIRDMYFRGQEISFMISGYTVNAKSVGYIRGRVIGDGEIEVRLHPKMGSERWKRFCKTGSRFVGKIKTIKNGYLLITLRTIKELNEKREEKKIPEDNGGKIEEYRIYNVGKGRVVNEETYKRLLENDCGVCGDPVFIEQEEELDWYGDSPICPTCSIDDVISFV